MVEIGADWRGSRDDDAIMLAYRVNSERDWLRNSAKVWDIIKNSFIVAEYCKTLLSSDMLRRLIS